MVANTHAVVNPRAMVVEALHASVAKSAVSRPLSPNDFTVWAERARVEFLN